MVSRGIHIGYTILHMPLVRFYLDYFDGFGKLKDIYFAYRCQKAKIMPSFDKTGVAQIAPDWGEYSCRCHGKRVISAPSKPLKLKLAGHIL